MSDLKFGQKVIETPNEDGSVTIRTEGYYEGLSSVKIQTREDIATHESTLLADVIRCLDVLKVTPTPELVIRIVKDRYGAPARIQKTWLESKEKLK